MATRTQKMKVGIFLVACIAVLAGGSVVISGYKRGDHSAYYIHFNESILGLSRGGLVEYTGVPVGKVSDIRVSESRSVRVDIEVQDDDITLYQGVQAQLVIYSIATGVMAVSLSGGDPSLGKLPPGSEIPSKPSLLASTTGSIPEIMKKVSDIADEIDTGLKGIEEGQIKNMIDDADAAIKDIRDVFDETSETLKDVRAKAVEGVDDARKLMEEIRAEIKPFTENTTELVKSANETMNTINEKVKPLDLAKTEQEVQETLRSVRELADSVRAMTEQLDTVTKTAVYQVGNVEFTVNETMTALTEALDALRALAVVLKENPSAIVYGPVKPKGAE
ncbi:MAG TPA: MlaD family protein [Candidatus Hydrogenedentes bacterium]|nr:MlaD family protein [Candidatus Hydrogenedentota bacterium]HQE81871.1 MlaD family protein [Candidatus Hydrogenedentota bacterium]HQH51162.1 MlaD family protein [Candidatus Hydrogenedentota bacterium]HQM47468.1 MlaD family protein [Candidatus Hydrogenedentota bacterium]